MNQKNIYRLLTFVFLLGTVVSCSQYKVYSVKDSPTLRLGGGVLYALPKTELCIAVTVERRDLSAAPYSAFAADFLGVAPDAVDTSFRIIDIDITGHNVADQDNYYFVKINRGSVVVDNRHLLLAVGCDAPVAQPASTDGAAATRPSSGIRAEYNLYDRSDTFYTRFDTPGRPTMVSSRKDIRSLKQRAADAAERLEQVQSKKQELINGEYEGSYGAESVQYLYSLLDKRESEIVASFCGTVRRETVRFYVTPVMKRNEDFCDTVVWFSPSEGFIGDAGNLPDDAFPVICTVHNDNTMRSAGRFVRYHTSGVTTNGNGGHTGTAAAIYRGNKNFRYRIPEQTSATVYTPVFSVSRTVPVSQLGPTVQLPRRCVMATFDPNTLDLMELKR